MNKHILIYALAATLISLILAGCGTAVTPERPSAANTPQPPTAVPSPTDAPTPTPANTAVPTPTAAPPEPAETATPDNETQTQETIPRDETLFSSNMLAEYTGVTISFQHPRPWQTSYFSDSGVNGWLVSDADPNEAFWSALRTGEELSLLIMPGDPARLRPLPEDVIEIERDDGKTAVYTLSDGKILGRVVTDAIAFEIFGDYPPEREADFQAGIETIFATFTWEALNDVDLSDVWLLGVRAEGEIEPGDSAAGYVPLASISEWLFTGAEDQQINLTVETRDPEVTLLLDILDENGESLLPGGAESFVGDIMVNDVEIPASGVYRIQVTAPTGFEKLGPWNPPAEAKVYGWYDIALK